MEGNYRRALAGSVDDPYLTAFGEEIAGLAERAEAIARAVSRLDGQGRAGHRRRGRDRARDRAGARGGGRRRRRGRPRRRRAPRRSPRRSAATPWPATWPTSRPTARRSPSRSSAAAGSTSSTSTPASATGCGVGEDFDLALYRRAMGANLDGVVFGMHAALPALRARGGGAIVATASLAGLTGVALGSALRGQQARGRRARPLARPALEAEGIRFNAVCPGFAESAIIDPIRDGARRERRGDHPGGGRRRRRGGAVRRRRVRRVRRDPAGARAARRSRSAACPARAER